MIRIEEEASLGNRETFQQQLVLPEVRFDLRKLNNEGKKSGVGLIILEDTGKTKILLGLHNSRNHGKNDKWGWFGETGEPGEESSIDTLARLVPEELGFFLPELELFGYEQDKLVRETELKDGDLLYRVAVYIVRVIPDHFPKSLVGESQPGYPREVVRREFYNLREVIDKSTELTMREFALPALRELDGLGYLDTPKKPLLPIVFPINGS